MYAAVSVAPVLSHKKRSIGHLEADANSGEKPPEDEEGEVWRGGDGDPAHHHHHAAGLGGLLRTEPPAQIPTQQTAKHFSNICNAH